MARDDSHSATTTARLCAAAFTSNRCSQQAKMVLVDEWKNASACKSRKDRMSHPNADLVKQDERNIHVIFPIKPGANNIPLQSAFRCR
mmetsp:Transcript_23373/g.48058  ORF Transcript_23373/g.48058 Transcript_23373/m.48058 type:complete len:88 (-) Transcript_23373:258-521(-)